MSLMKLCFYKVVYEAIAKHLPSSNVKLNFGSKKLRYKCAKGIISSIGNNVNIEKGAVFSRKVSVGDNSGIGKYAFIQGEVHIGKNVMMGPECHIWTYNHETKNTDIPMCEQGIKNECPVFIGNDVWIGDRVTILPGVKIGDGVVIGAGAVVAKDIPSYCVAAGVPAKVVKNRKESEIQNNDKDLNNNSL